MDCSICFYAIKRQNIKISCCNKECTCIVCGDCIGSMIDFCTNNISTISVTLPMCPNTNCRRDYLITDLSKLSDEKILKYAKLCFEFLKIDNSDVISNLKNQENMIKKIRDDRLSFIKQTFPDSIKYIIEIALKNKSNKINNSNKLCIQKILQNSNIKCYNIMCTGILILKTNTTKHECNICKVVFCKLCEKNITGNNHICNQNDLDSINFKNTLVKCPKCLIQCVKSYGCNNITCPICQINFDYITGKKTAAGNHHDITLKLNDKNKYKPSVYYIKDYQLSLIYLMREIEDLEPDKTTIQNTLNIIIKSEYHYIDISKKYAKYKQSMYKSQLYTKCLLLIQEAHAEKKIDETFLRCIIKKLQ